jgi:nitrogen PTS system EIIA component
MRLGVRDAARLLSVSEKTVYRWISQGRLPAHRVNEQYRFNRAELLEWATSQRVNVSPEILEEPDQEGAMPGLEESLRAGGIHYRVGGREKASVLGCVVEQMPLPEEVDRPFLLQVLKARELLGSTAVGGGVAIPHVRNPIVMHIPKPMVCLCFLEGPVDFGALDGEPVHTLFTIVSPTIKAHLNLLSRLAFALREPGFSSVIAAKGSREDILRQAGLIDDTVANRAAREVAR